MVYSCLEGCICKKILETIKCFEPIAEENLVSRLFNYSEYLFNYTDYHSYVK